METTPEFERLAHCFYQGSFENYTDRPVLIATAISLANFTDVQLDALRHFMDKLLAESDDELEKAWIEADANYWFRGPGAMREFLTQIRQMLDEPGEALERLSEEGRKRLKGE
ncbi:MAG TPA: hypothetical protein VKV96_16040 [Roseiarcus sp.]|nr:hypothetical protein [Roseiarcus sp.]